MEKIPRQRSVGELVNKLSTCTVLCIGDVMLDRFVQGKVERISPEAPIPVLRMTSEKNILGGVGNVARNLEGLGISTLLVGGNGKDKTGQAVQDLLKQHTLISPHLISHEKFLTPLKIRYISGNQHLLRVDQETSVPFPDSIIQKLQDVSLQALPKASALILSDYGKGVLNRDLIKGLIAEAQKNHTPVIVDPKGRDYARYEGATLVTPNRQELAQATEMETDCDESCIAAAQEIIKTCKIKMVLVTRGPDGMTLVTDEGYVEHVRATALEVFDVSGAGDTVVALMASSLGAGLTLTEAVHLANKAGGIVVGKAGTAVVSKEELLADSPQEKFQTAERKVYTLEEAIERRLRWQRKGQTVGFTNGTFDLLHPGHISSIEEARQHCDKLFIGVNTDSSVKRYKGPTRPIQSEMARATVLASLQMVDGVVLFEEDTPLKLIEGLRPDVLIKGADYKIENIVGADVVHSYGGKVVLAQIVPGQSTTRTVEKLAV